MCTSDQNSLLLVWYYLLHFRVGSLGFRKCREFLSLHRSLKDDAMTIEMEDYHDSLLVYMS